MADEEEEDGCGDSRERDEEEAAPLRGTAKSAMEPWVPHCGGSPSCSRRMIRSETHPVVR